MGNLDSLLWGNFYGSRSPRRAKSCRTAPADRMRGLPQHARAGSCVDRLQPMPSGGAVGQRGDPARGPGRSLLVRESERSQHQHATSVHGGETPGLESPGRLARLRRRSHSQYDLVNACLPPLRRVPRRALPPGARRARRRVFHPGRVEGRSPSLLVVPRELKVVALASPFRRRRVRQLTRNRARCAGRAVPDGMRASSTRRSRQPHGGAGRVGRARATRSPGPLGGGSSAGS